MFCACICFPNGLVLLALHVYVRTHIFRHSFLIVLNFLQSLFERICRAGNVYKNIYGNDLRSYIQTVYQQNASFLRVFFNGSHIHLIIAVVRFVHRLIIYITFCLLHYFCHFHINIFYTASKVVTCL